LGHDVIARIIEEKVCLG